MYDFVWYRTFPKLCETVIVCMLKAPSLGSKWKLNWCPFDHFVTFAEKQFSKHKHMHDFVGQTSAPKIAKLSAIASCVLSVLSPTWELVYSNLFTFTQLREKHCSKPKHLHDLVWQRLVQKECAAVIVCLLPGICAVSYSNPNMNTKLKFKKLR